MQAAPRGITFRETMRGPFGLGVTDPRAGADQGRSAGNDLAIHVTVTIDDLDRFIEDPAHLGALAGRLEFPPFGRPLAATRGVFNLFSPAESPDLKLMVYELAVSRDGRPYYLAGRKEVRGDHHGLDLWADTTTLYATLHEGTDASGPVVGAGVLSLGALDLARLVTTVRVPGATGGLDTTQTIGRFGAFFLGELWDTYGAPLVRPRPRWRRTLETAFGRVRSAVQSRRPRR